MEKVHLDPGRYLKTENYELKRALAYIIDLVVVLLGVVFVALLLSVDLSGYKTWLMVLIIAGIFNWLVKSVMEGMRGESIGKGMMGLRVIDAYGPVTLGESLLRNLFQMVPVVLPLLDYALGNAVANDGRQKLFDSISGTLVIEDIPEMTARRTASVRDGRARPEPREKVVLDHRKTRVVGYCPRCGHPYRVLRPEDSSFSNLWNHRCTWCNYQIPEGPEEG